MLDYSDHLLEISSIQKLSKSSEYRVLDTRPWNHYLVRRQKAILVDLEKELILTTEIFSLNL